MSGREGHVLVVIAAVLVFAVAPVIVSARIAERRGRSVWFGMALAVLLGWIGVVVLLLSGRGTRPVRPAGRTRPCPGCAVAMPATAGTCHGCRTVSTPWVLHGGHWWSRDADGEWRYLDDARSTWVSPRDGSAEPGSVSESGSASAKGGSAAWVGLDHVQVAAPPDREFDARRFYSGLLGLAELEKPPLLAGRGGCWFQVGAHELHVGVVPQFAPATKAHAALRLRSVAELDAVAARLAEAGYEVVRPDPEETPGTRRLHVDDPFGNRLELVSMIFTNGNPNR